MARAHQLGRGVPIDRQEARRWLQKAVDLGEERAKRLLAELK